MEYLEAAWRKSPKYKRYKKERLTELGLDESALKNMSIEERKKLKEQLQLEQVIEAAKVKPISLGELMKKEFPETEWLVEKLIPASTVVALSGYAGCGKTWFVLKMAIDIAQGGLFLGQFPTSKTAVLLLDEETGERWLRRRMEMLGADQELPIYIHSKTGFHLQDDKIEELLPFIKKKSIGLVIIDSFSQVHTAESENDAAQMAKVFKKVQKFVKEGVSVLFIHHHRKPGLMTSNITHDMRGSSHILAAIDVHLVVERKKKEDALVITQSKNRQEEEIQSFKVNIIKDDEKFDLEFDSYIEEEESKRGVFADGIQEYLERLEGKPIFQRELFNILQGQGVEGGYSTYQKAVKELIVAGKVFEKLGRHNRKFLSNKEVTEEDLRKLEEPEKQSLFEQEAEASEVKL